MATADIAEHVEQLEQDNIRHEAVETQLKEEQAKQRAEQVQQGKEQGRSSGLASLRAVDEAAFGDGFRSLVASVHSQDQCVRSAGRV